MVMQKKSLGDFLIEKGVLTEEKLATARDLQRSTTGDLGDILVDLGFAGEREIAEARAQEMGLQYYDLARNPGDPDVATMIPQHMARRYNVLAIKKDANNRILVAISDPKFRPANLEDIRRVTKLQPVPVLVSRSDLTAALNRYLNGTSAPGTGPQGAAKPGSNGHATTKNGLTQHSRPSRNGVGPSSTPVPITNGNGNGNGTGAATGGSAVPALVKDDLMTPAMIDGTMQPASAASNGPVGSFVQSGTGMAAPKSDLENQLQKELLDMAGADDEDDNSMEQGSDDAPIIRISHTIIQQAIREGASDIHIEPEKRGVRIRYRIDGVLNEIMTVPNHIKQPLIARFKIMADLNIAERRVPQDGRIPIRTEGKDYDLRVSTVPTIAGEKIVMRVLDKGSIQLTMDQLGFAPDVRAKVDDIIVQPQGMLLITGPTGSGKTTTLYSILNKVSTVEKNVMTAEDPAEYQLAGINQVSMNKKAGLNFANTLRAFLRQDPDIIMVGEMRDLETSQIAVEAALTGHFVLSTLHTNDAPSAVLRLADMGVETFLIANTVTGVIAQRLARRICSACKEPYEVPAATLRRFGFKIENPDQKITLYNGAGCDRCRGTGFKSRIGLYELMPIDDEVREMIVTRASINDIRNAAKKQGMKEMREDGLLKVLDGMTTPDEVMRVVFTTGSD
jgi:type IV pilus assembly protein PilB